MRPRSSSLNVMRVCIRPDKRKPHVLIGGALGKVLDGGHNGQEAQHHSPCIRAPVLPDAVWLLLWQQSHAQQSFGGRLHDEPCTAAECLNVRFIFPTIRLSAAHLDVLLGVRQRVVISLAGARVTQHLHA